MEEKHQKPFKKIKETEESYQLNTYNKLPLSIERGEGVYVYDSEGKKYLDLYGLDTIFPVAKTPIGNLAALASEEIKFPEVARCMAMRGAQVIICNASRLTEHAILELEVCSRARAIENMAYLATASHASASVNPLFFSGGSVIYVFQGRILKRAPEGAFEAYVNAPIDINSLRYLRNSSNPLTQLKVEAFAETYQKTSIWPINRFMKSPMKDLKDLGESLKIALENMRKNGILTLP